MTIEETQARTAYTKEQADIYDIKRFSTAGGIRIHETELEILRSALNYIPINSNILEVGCGTGRFIIETSSMGYQVNGLDASPSMLEKLKEKTEGLGKVINLRVGDADNLPYDDQSYDFVYSIRVLNQTESSHYALKVISEMLRVTKPGGFVLVEFVNARRPRIGRNNTKTTRLTYEQVTKAGIYNESSVIEIRGAFLFGMGSMDKLGKYGAAIVSWLDKKISRVLPKFCSRIYVLLEKNI